MVNKISCQPRVQQMEFVKSVFQNQINVKIQIIAMTIMAW